MGLRLAGIAIGAQIGVTAAVAGVVVAQAITTVSILALGFSGLRSFPSARPAPLGDDRGPIIRFVAQSAAYTGLISLRTVGRAARARDRPERAPRWASSARRRCRSPGSRRSPRRCG